MMSHLDDTSPGALARQTKKLLAASGAHLAGRKVRPDTDPVHRHSYDVDDERAQPWRRGRIGDGRRDRMKAHWRALRITLQEQVQRHKRERVSGPDRLQANDLLVLDAVLDYYRHNTGKCFPEQQTIADDTGLSRRTIGEACQRLRANGYFAWVRRTRPTGGAGVAGPQLKQTSNAYFFDWRRRMHKDAWARFQQLLRRFLAKLGLHDGVPPPALTAPAQPSPMGQALASLGVSVWSAREE